MKITPLANTRKVWTTDDGKRCRYTRRGRPRLVIRLSTFVGTTAICAQHWYCKVTGQEPEVLYIDTGNVVFMGGYGENKPRLNYTFDAERTLYKVEKDLMGDVLGDVGDTTSRFNDPENALRAGIQCAKDNFADTSKFNWKVQFEGPLGEHFDLAELRLDELDADEILNAVEWEHDWRLTLDDLEEK
jgi:hypothetical protein